MGTGGSGSEAALSVHQPIVTGRLWLRPRQPADEPALGAMAAVLAVAANLCTTIAPEGDTPLAIVDRATGELVGGANAGPSGLGTGVEVAVWVGEPWWGRGFGTEATQGLIDSAFRNAAVDAVWCLNRVTNPRGRRIVEKCGFQFRGAGMVRRPGRGAFPIERFALDRRSWVSLKAWGLAPEPAAIALASGNAA
jgi:RimJ/RimL family protein N-acetyltransferase